MDTRVKPAYDKQWRYHASLGFYSITACSGASACLRSAALLEPIMIASGIAHSVKIITIWLGGSRLYQRVDDAGQISVAL
jgi:hypothetical protein